MTDKQNIPFHSLAGQLLIAMPSMDDERFEKAVIYISAHTEETGAMGLVINRPAQKINFADIVDQMGILKNDRIHQPDILLGGPDQITRGFILHSDDYAQTPPLSHYNNISLTTSEDILKDVVTGHGPKDILLALGCATWISGQLEEEIMSNVWLTAPANSDLLFHEPYSHRWEKALSSIGVEAPMLSNEFGKS